MSALREVAQQALEALEHATPTTDWSYMITALRAALAQQDEPRNQCGETCERARLCAACARELSHE